MTAGFPPATIADLAVDLRVPAWTPITTYVYQAAPPAITRGKPDESSQATPAQCAMEWNNRDGRFSPGNPAGPYYGSLRRNTQVRLSMPASSTYLRFADDTTSACSCPSSAGLNPAGDLDIRVDTRLASNVPSVLASKYLAAGDQRSWALWVDAGGLLYLGWSTDGTFGGWHQVASTVPLPLGRAAVRATLDISYTPPGALFTVSLVTFYTAPSIGGSWTQLGAASYGTVTATTVFASTAPVMIGANPDLTGFGTPGCLGRVFGFQFLSGIAGSTLASPDFTTATPGAATLTDAQANVWTVAGTAGFSSREYRFHGEIASLPQRWDVTGKDIRVPVTAASPLRRLTQAAPVLASPLRRAVLSLAGTFAPAGYWPMEDGKATTQIGPAIGAAPMNIAGTPTMASFSGFACSAPIPVLNGATLAASVPAAPGLPPAAVLRFLMAVPAGGDTNGGIIARLLTGATVARLDLVYGTGGTLNLIGYNYAGTQLFTSGVTAFGVNGTLLAVSLELAAGGWTLVTVAPGAATGGVVTGGFAITPGPMTGIVFNPGGALVGTAIGHAYAQTAVSSVFDLGRPLNAWAGETAGARFSRLCAENGITGWLRGWQAVTGPMGAQPVATLATLLQQCEDTDRGMIFDPRDGPGLGYRTSRSLCGQAAALTLDYAAAAIGDGSSATLDPVSDDQFTRNDVTVTRAGGAAVTAVLSDGSGLSVSPPPAGVGDYQYSITASLNQDTQAADLAGWILHVGTTSDDRYSVVPLNLARSEFQSLIQAWLDFDIGDFVQITNPPAWLPPGTIRQLAAAISETIGGWTYSMRVTGIPESPYEVAAADDTVFGRADTGGSTLRAAITSGATSLTADSSARPWTAASGDYPFDIAMGGERIALNNAPAGPGMLVGSTVDQGPMGEASFATAVSDWQAWTGQTLKVIRRYLGPSVTTTSDTILAYCAANGVKAIIDLEPAYSPVSATDLANIAAMLAYWQGQGLQMEVTLWAEPFGHGLSAGQFIAMFQYYGPAVRAYCQVTFCTAVYSVIANGENSYYPGDAWVDKVATDYYAFEYAAGSMLDLAAVPANAASPRKPFGIYEFGAFPQGFNFLDGNWSGATGDNAGFEGGIGSWAVTGNASLSQAGSGHTGGHGLSMSSVAAGNMSAVHTGPRTAAMPCAPGDTIAVGVWAKAAVSARNVVVGAEFFNASNVSIGELDLAPAADSAAAWTHISGTVTAPANSVNCRLAVTVQATGGAAEVHYIDDCVLGDNSHGQSPAVVTAFHQYILGFMTARLSAGYPNGDLVQFNSGDIAQWSGNPLVTPVAYDNQGAGTISTDSRVALWQSIYTALNGTGTPQTFTGVTRAVNGVVKAHVAGEDIRLFYPPVTALT